MAKNVFEEIYGSLDNNNNNENHNRETEEEKEEKASKLSFSLVAGIGGIIVALFCTVSLFLCYSYDLCIFFDKYYLYIVCGAGCLLLYGVFSSIFALRKKFNIMGVINTILCLVAIVIFVAPFIFGLVYLQIGD